MTNTTGALLAAARHLSDRDIVELGRRIDDELVGADATPTLRALRELAQGNTGAKPGDDLDPLD